MRASELLSDRGSMAGILCAHSLRQYIGRDHPLELPISEAADAWGDYSVLPLNLGGLARLSGVPRLSVDIRPLMDICRGHEEGIGLARQWSYDLFYLELLAKERKLVPLFWAPAGLSRLLQCHRQALHLSAGNHEAAIEAVRKGEAYWQEHADDWLAEGTIELHDDRPWLARLAVGAPDDPTQRSPARTQLTDLTYRLLWSKLPFYDGDRTREIVLQEMKMELWRTSVFCQTPVSNVSGKWLAQQRFRLCIEFRHRTEQQRRTEDLEGYVCRRHDEGAGTGVIAREILERRLFPTQDRRRRDAEFKTPPEDSARRRVRAILRQQARPGKR